MGGIGELPFRPASEIAYYTTDPDINTNPRYGRLDQAQGLYIPNAGSRRLLAEDNLGYTF